ncbi:MAG: hypothetical protein NT173_01545 [Opitutales bacterium]|nr:hypothetical protein [Opitutales bacterium]
MAITPVLPACPAVPGRPPRARRCAGPALLTSLLALGLWAGCLTPPGDGAANPGPGFTPVNYVGDPVLPRSVRRVVLLPLAGATVAPAASLAALDPVLAAALQRQNRFEVVALPRLECLRLFSAEELSSVAALPANFMAVLRREYAADAVLLVDVTVFRAYRPLAIGLRAKLATVQEVRLVWTFDTLFSAADPAVAASARRHFLAGGRREGPADLSPAALQSPSLFAGYAVEAMFATPPPLATAGSPVPAGPDGAGAPDRADRPVAK